MLSSGIWRPVLALILASVVIMGSPGPSTMSATAVAAAYGFRRSLMYAGGLIVRTPSSQEYLDMAGAFAVTSVFREAPVVDALVKTALLSVMIVIIHMFWLLAGASLSRVLQDPTSPRIVNVLLAVSLAVTS